MCGIAGIVRPKAANLEPIFRMTEVQRHRGPDGDGHLFVSESAASPVVSQSSELDRPPFGQLALGHRRLAIIDCSDAGRQPMSYANGRLWITYNGEVYNHVELRAELTALGYRFASRSDTEVILAAYQAWGTRCFARLNGMWALAIWDSRDRRLILSRDRLGIKPLCYTRVGEDLVFTSEIKGLLEYPGVGARMNVSTARAYLAHSVTNHSNASLFEGIESFPPGCFAIVDPQRPVSIEPQKYWDLAASASVERRPDEVHERFRALFESSVKQHLRSDVRVGACLSGGLDSSAIVCQMAQLGANPVHTFTAMFADPQFDESRWAGIVNDAVGARAHWSTPGETALLDDLEDLVWHQEEPFSNASVYAQWSVMRQARDAGVLVLLDGQGADETLLGYRKFYFYHLRDLLAQGAWSKAASGAASLALFGDRGAFNPLEAIRYIPRRLLPRGAAIAEYFHDCAPEGTGEFNRGLGRKSLSEHQHADLTQFSLPALLRYEDRNSMAWSIESRVPFLDHRLVEFLFSLPAELKLGHGLTKLVMRRALSRLLPKPIVERRDKKGFATPQSVWMQGQLGARMIDEIERCSLLDSVLDRRRMIADWRGASSIRRAAMQTGFFRAGVFAIWARRFSIS